MKKFSLETLDKIYGGTNNISGPIMNGLNNIIKLLYDAGHAVGSSLRRIKEHNLCPLE